MHWISATKTYRAGRASGGCLYGFKKEIQKQFNLKFLNIKNNTLLSANFNNNVFYIIPKYLNCTNWKVDFENFETMLTELNPTNFCILGDLNARIGEEQVLDENELQDLGLVNHIRCSKDKTVNWQGRRLLDAIENVGGIVLNGRMVGDEQGNFSFCGVMGSSVIDYCICSYSLLQFVEKFSIASKPYSDHMPLILKFDLPTDSNSNVMDSSIFKLRWNDKHVEKFQQNLIADPNVLSPKVNRLPVDDLVYFLHEKIKSAYPNKVNKTIFDPKQKWFDWKCFRLRSTMLKNLKAFRKEHTAINKYRYNFSRYRYLNTCEQKKIDFLNNNLKKLDAVKNSKDWWNLTNSLKTHSQTSKSFLNSNSFVAHFESLLNKPESRMMCWCIPCNVDPFLDSPFEYIELLSVIKSLKHNKSPGLDGIPYEFYKNAPPCFLNELLQVFNAIFIKEEMPISFRKSIIVPLFKKGDPNVAANYRGLSLIDTVCKIFNNILLNRIEDWLEKNKILNEFQAGFRKQYSTIDNIFNLVNIVSLNSIKSKYTYAFFVDFSCAFDTIPRNSLFYKLASIGLSSKIIRILQQLYENTVSLVWDGCSLSEEFTIKTGVKQGCILSPILFSLFLNDLPDILPGGLEVAGVNVKLLLYADDIVILSDSPVDLQNMIDSLHAYCATWSLSVNLSKSKVMIFRKSPRLAQNLNWHYGMETIEIVNSYTYLGVDLTYNLSFNKHLQNKLSASKISISSTWSKYISNTKISSNNKFKIFNAASKSIMLYAAQVWGYVRYDCVEKLLRFYVKKLHYLPANTPNYMINLETSIDPMFFSTLKLHFTYLNRVLSLNCDRLPRILANEVIKLNISWAKEWQLLCQSINFSPPNNSLPLCHYWKEILDTLKRNDFQNFQNQASNSQFHDLYSKLDHNVAPLLTDLSPRASSLIIRARGGLLEINAKCFKANTDGYCTICNTKEPENTLHFIGICPVYKNYRKNYFGKQFLGLSEVINILNGKYSFKKVYNFIESSLKLRNLIVNEFDPQ